MLSLLMILNGEQFLRNVQQRQLPRLKIPHLDLPVLGHNARH